MSSLKAVFVLLKLHSVLPRPLIMTSLSSWSTCELFEMTGPFCFTPLSPGFTLDVWHWMFFDTWHSHIIVDRLVIQYLHIAFWCQWQLNWCDFCVFFWITKLHYYPRTILESFLKIVKTKILIHSKSDIIAVSWY